MKSRKNMNDRQLQEKVRDYWSAEKLDAEMMMSTIWDLIQDFIMARHPDIDALLREKGLGVERLMTEMSLACYEKMPRYDPRTGTITDFMLRIIRARWNGPVTKRDIDIYDMMKRIEVIRNEHEKLRLRGEPACFLPADGGEQSEDAPPVQPDDPSPGVPD